MSKLGQLAAAREKAELQRLIQVAMMAIAKREGRIEFSMEELATLQEGDNIAVTQHADGLVVEFVPKDAEPPVPA